MEKAKIRAAAYCRVSTEQELQDLSFESQCHYYRQLIESDPEMELVDIYGDHGKSGRHVDGRPEFQRMIEDCRAGKIDLIYTKSVSRMARNLSDLINLEFPGIFSNYTGYSSFLLISES